MKTIKLKLNAASVLFIKEIAEYYLAMPSDSYTMTLEQDMLARLLKRKAVMFMYPPEMCSLTISVAESAVIYRLASGAYVHINDLNMRNCAAMFTMVIGPKLPPEADQYLMLN